jgi:chromosome segregation ATPase
MVADKLENKLAGERRELAGLEAERGKLLARRDRTESERSLAGVALGALMGKAKAQEAAVAEAAALGAAVAELDRRIEAQQDTIAETERDLAAAQVAAAQELIDAAELRAAKALHAFLEATEEAEAAFQEVVAQAKAHGLAVPKASFDGGARTNVQQALGGYGREYARRTGRPATVTAYVPSTAGMLEVEGQFFVNNPYG